MPGRFDAIVVGAGAAGCIAAMRLARRGYTVRLLVSDHARVDRLELVSPLAFEAFRAAGISTLLSDRTCSLPCPGIRRQLGPEQVEFDEFLRWPGGQGFVVDRTVLDERLLGLAADHHVDIVHDRVRSLQRDDGELVLRGTNEHHARFVIDASGRAAVIARRLGPRRKILSRMLTQRERSTAGEGDWFSVSWMGPAWSWVARGPNGRIEAWRALVSAREPGARIDAGSSFSPNPVGDRWIAIGDAAASFDPSCSQGLFHAVATATWASDALDRDVVLSETAQREYRERTLRTAANAELARRQMYGTLVSSP